jgi:hypothetical protein
MTTALRLPPSERDFYIYQSIHVRSETTRAVADRCKISQTRVRQIVNRVIQWLAAILPPEADLPKESEAELARRIAADQVQHLTTEVAQFWHRTYETKFVGPLLRLFLAQARLGVVPGSLDSLHADALDAKEANDTPSPSETPAEHHPILPSLFPSVSPSPPSRDCSTSDAPASAPPPPSPPSLDLTPTATTLSIPVPAPSSTSSPPSPPPSKPLLNSSTPSPTVLRVTPDQPGLVTLDTITRRRERCQTAIPRRGARK